MQNNIKGVFSNRGRLIELLVLINLSFLAIDIYVAHSVNEFAHWAEWIPFYFSCISPIVLIIAYYQKLRHGNRKLYHYSGMFIGVLSVFVGISGMFFHLQSQFFELLTIKSLVYTAPFAAPLSYAGLGFLLLLNRMVIPSTDEWRRWLIFLVLAGFVGNFFLSLCDHAQNGFFSITEWIPVFSSAIAIGFLVVLVFARKTNCAFLKICFSIMIIQIVVGILGFVLHLNSIMHSNSEFVFGNIIFGAPIFAPLLFPNIALFGLLGIWDWYKVSKFVNEDC